MIDVMKQALEALEYHQEQTRPIHKTQETITALRKAIEQAEKQEPVAWMQDRYELYIQSYPDEWYKIPLYTAPPKREWVGINIDEIPSLWGNADADLWLFAQDIETKLKERNT